MGTDLTTLEDRALEVAPDLSRPQIEVLKNTIARGTSDDEFLLFLVTCKQLGLNPFALEIQSIKFDRDAPPTPYPTILGRLRKARETGQLEYIKGPFWTADGEKWVDVWLDEKNHPKAAKVVGKRKDWTEPLTAVASWRSFARYTYRGGAKKLMYTWDAMGDHMIGNAALRLFLKRAFGFEDDGEDVTEGEVVEAPGPTDEQLAFLEKLAKARGLTEQNLANMAGADTFEELAQEEVSFLITQLKAENQIDKRLEAVDPWANLKSPTEVGGHDTTRVTEPLSAPKSETASREDSSQGSGGGEGSEGLRGSGSSGSEPPTDPTQGDGPDAVPPQKSKTPTLDWLGDEALVMKLADHFGASDLAENFVRAWTKRKKINVEKSTVTPGLKHQVEELIKQSEVFKEEDDWAKAVDAAQQSLDAEVVE